MPEFLYRIVFTRIYAIFRVFAGGREEIITGYQGNYFVV